MRITTAMPAQCGNNCGRLRLSGLTEGPGRLPVVAVPLLGVRRCAALNPHDQRLIYFGRGWRRGSGLRQGWELGRLGVGLALVWHVGLSRRESSAQMI
jgi:hypothetical protein